MNFVRFFCYYRIYCLYLQDQFNLANGLFGIIKRSGETGLAETPTTTGSLPKGAKTHPGQQEL